MTSLLVTNDFPPKLGGIQSYLWELWRRLPAHETTVLTTRYAGDAPWDARQGFRVVRTPESQLWPTGSLARRIDGSAREVDADVVFLDPWLPLGALAPRLRAAPVVLVLHGAEVTVPARLPGARRLGAHVLHAAAGVVAAGTYAAAEAARLAGAPLSGLVIPPGVDVARFRPATVSERAVTRRRIGIPPGDRMVLAVSRLVPRKGFDVLIDAVAGLGPGVHLVIAGGGRDRARFEARAARTAAPVHFLGRVPDDETFPQLFASADVFAMPCRTRWGGLEAEGFGIVFLEAAAAGVPVVAGRSGGSDEAVVDGETGFVIEGEVAAVHAALERVLADEPRRVAMGEAARARAVAEFDYDVLAARLAPIAAGDLDRLGPLG